MAHLYADNTQFALRVLLAAGLVALVVLLVAFAGLLLDILLLVFAAVLLVVAVDGLVRLLQRYLPLRRIWALLLALVGIALLLTGTYFLIGPQIGEQVPRLLQQLPEALQELIAMLHGLPGIEALLEQLQQDDGNGLGPQVLGWVGGLLSGLMGAVTGFAIIVLVAFYILLSPHQYIAQVLRLFPKGRRERLGQVLQMQGRALRLWLLSRLISMVFVGVATAIGLRLLDVPLPYALGLISGLLTFIPYLGPILAAVPTAAVALMESPQLALYAVLLYFAVEMMESNVVFPMAAKGVVHLPPAYTVIIQVAGGAVAGFAGLVLATPLVVAATVMVQMLYIEDTLGDSLEVLGEAEGEAGNGR